jgi:hypothetical protein
MIKKRYQKQLSLILNNGHTIKDNKKMPNFAFQNMKFCSIIYFFE